MFTLAFKQKNIDKLRLSAEELDNFCSGDRKVNFTLKLLNKYANKKQDKHILPQNIQLDSSSIFSKASLDHNSSIVSLKNNQVTMSDHLKLVSAWWKEIDSLSSGQVNSLLVAQKLLELGFVDNLHEGKKLLGGTEMVNYYQFQQAFARSMIKGAIRNLSNKLSSGDFANSYLTPSMKLSAYKRKLMITSIKPKADLNSTVPNPVRGIEMYNRYVRSISPKKT